MSEARSGYFRGLALMVASAGCFAGNALLIRGLGRFLQVNVWLLTSIRFAIGLLVIAAIFRRAFQPGHLLRNRKLIERGAVGGLGVICYYAAIVHVGAGRSTFINSTYIFWAAFMAAAACGERLRPITLAGGAAALAGVALLTDAFGNGARPSAYDLLAVLSALGSAYVAVTIRQLHATEHTATIFGAQCAYGLAICGPPAAWHPQALPGAGWLLAVLSGLCVAAGQLAQTRAYRDLPVAMGSLVQTLCPLGTVVGGMVFFGERLSPWELLGAALILAGTLSTALRPAAAGAPA